MNYRHIYHVGNFADVFKHCVLIALLRELLKKDRPFCYLDTHAGIGIYDFRHMASQKTLEYKQGIARIYSCETAPDVIQRYLQIVHQCNRDIAGLVSYPGSPKIVQALLRTQDRMILSELHSEDVKVLKDEFKNDSRVAVHHLDGYLSMKAFLPPKENRGLVLIDPPYECTDEITKIIASLTLALKHWRSGIYAVWYPIKEQSDKKDFQNSLQNICEQKVLFSEFMISDLPKPEGLVGSGMAIINSPWHLSETLTEVTEWLQRYLNRNL